MEDLANACDISRSTASRFFSGRPTSLAVTLKILEALHLQFQDVASPEPGNDPDGVSGGTAGAGITRKPYPNGGADGAVNLPEAMVRRWA